MSVLGQGIIPSGTNGTELAAITRRAFIPSLIVQIYQATPTLAAALANAQTASGGVSSVTAPVQGAPLVTPQYTDFSGSFNQPGIQVGIQDAEYDLKAIVVPIPFLGMEGLVQMNAAVIPRIEARMNDAGNGVADQLSYDMFNNAADGNTISGFPFMALATGTYGNISRTTNTWWAGHAMTTAGSVNPTRQLIMQMIVSAAKANGGEMPNIGIAGPGTWTLLSQDFLGQEQYVITPDKAFDGATQGPRSGFTALMVMGVPIYMDMEQPEGTVLLFNTRYTSFYIHEAAAFVFTGFASTLPNMQLGYVGALVAVLEFVCVKPASVTTQAGYLYATV